MDDFYDRLAPLYDLILTDRGASFERQAEQIGGLIPEHEAQRRQGHARPSPPPSDEIERTMYTLSE